MEQAGPLHPTQELSSLFYVNLRPWTAFEMAEHARQLCCRIEKSFQLQFEMIFNLLAKHEPVCPIIAALAALLCSHIAIQGTKQIAQILCSDVSAKEARGSCESSFEALTKHAGLCGRQFRGPDNVPVPLQCLKSRSGDQLCCGLHSGLQFIQWRDAVEQAVQRAVYSGVFIS